MKSIAFTALVSAVALTASAGAFATPVTLGGESPDLQTVINNLYLSPGCPTCSPVANAPNVNTDQVAESGVFVVEASGGSIATMIIEVAGNATTNTFGIYDPSDPTRMVELFSGANGAGAQALLRVNAAYQFTLNFSNPWVQFTNQLFGYYLSTASGSTFYSQPTRNGGADHMVAFQGDNDRIQLPGIAAGNWGPSSFILAWEDMHLAHSDTDYQDMVVYVESVNVPEPAMLGLLGLGLVGLAAARRRKST